MKFDKSIYREEFKRLLNTKNRDKFFIKKSDASFKISRFMKKGIDSFELASHVKQTSYSAKDYWTVTISYYSMLYMAKAAILSKGFETDDHYSTQIALGVLFVPDRIEKEDLELLNQTHKIFEEEYIDFFDDARKESRTSRYSATKFYSERRVQEVSENARKFIAKMRLILET